MTNKKTPSIRFKGFTDDWEQRKLGDIAKFINGRAYAQNELLPSGKYKVLRVGNFYTNDSWYYSDLELDDKYYANDGDLLYTWSATFGPHIWRGDRVIYHYHIWKIDLTDELEKHFAVQLLEQDKNDILSGHNGSTMAHITKEGMEQKKVVIPKNIWEQRQLGLFFDNLDNLITLHQRECERLQIVKKSMLENMFPKNGERVPKIRFSGFTDDWEQRKVSEIANRYDNLRVPVAASERVSGSTPYYGANGIQDYVDGYTHDGEFVLIAEDGANDLKNYPVQYTTGKIWVNNHAHVLQGKEKITDNKFLGYSINATNIESLLVGGGRAKLNAEVLMGIELLMPSYLEQCRISEFLFNLDNLITLHQSKLEKLRLIKKSMLEQMFV